ncbi:hypothetical protein BVC80_8655g5 [Macleaya cordata]|uniref:Inactive rhomboid protein n=1 Tax=Macleaya cordata TaxID=56857 RepID=A0A200Q2X0_MACCD|nr:hypothetical protein BVC80_8655g5 [Macleaya cordata]
MEDDGESFGGAYAAPPLVSLSPFFSPSLSTSSRRLSSNFSEPTRPIHAARRLSWVSLQGRLVGAEEASSAKAIGGSLSREEAVAWELFSPIHRILIVAVVAVATADLKKSRQILKLKRSVDLRDQVLLSMQQKLDDLCEQVNTMKDRPETGEEVLFTKNEEFPFNKNTRWDESKFSSCGCCPCDHHRVLSNGLMKDSVEKAAGVDEIFKFKPLMMGVEQEERRMSDLSDWASSVTSAADIQLNTLAVEQDIYNLQRECEEKDATIKELAAVVNATDAAGSKRISELEDVIRRKNMIISKLKKDMAVLEQKVVHLTRLRRPSSASTLNVRQLPVMADNLLYDMSSSSPSSSDSDCPIENPPQVSVSHEHQEISAHQNVTSRRNNRVVSQKPPISQKPPVSQKPPISLPKLADRLPKLRPVSPLTENSMNQRPNSPVGFSPNELVSSGGDQRRNRRRSQPGSKETAQMKRWV